MAINQSYGFWISFKRTVFVTSLYFRLMDYKKVDPEELKKFNREFYLVSRSDTLLFPVLTCKLLWKPRLMSKVNKLIQKNQLRQAIELVYAQSSKSLHYIDRDSMVRDIESVIRKVIRTRRYAA